VKKLRLLVFILGAALMCATVISVVAQTAISSWPYFAEATLNSGTPGLYGLTVPLQVMDKAREDLADLRLYDLPNREIPYALRIRREVDDKREIEARLFNEATVGLAAEVSVDIGENSGEHNEVEIQTTATNFRRRVNLEGSDTGKEWRTLETGGVIFNFQSQNNEVESNRINYPISRYRYLRIRVFADELTDKTAPTVTAVKVMMAVHEKGELTTWGVDVPSYQLLRNQGAHASSWTIDLGAQVPCDRLALAIADPSFSRPFQLEVVDDPQSARLIASGELNRHIGEEAKPLLITFDEEVHARKLRLLVTDYSNQTLSINSILASAPARQLVFELKQTPMQPLRLFFGNPKITAPHYDFERELSAKLSTQPLQVALGDISANPAYVPEPLPLTERVPWLIYLVLAASSIALALILISLARTAMQAVPLQPGETKTGNNH
jgi:Protein of unknown function (DUF3999)